MNPPIAKPPARTYELAIHRAVKQLRDTANDLDEGVQRIDKQRVKTPQEMSWRREAVAKMELLRGQADIISAL